MNSFLSSLDWNQLFSGTNVNHDVKKLYDILYSAIDTYIPLTTDADNTFPPWFTFHIKFKIFEKEEHT